MKSLRELEASWRRIESWLSVNAPTSHACVNAPAESREIDEAEATMGLAFPPELLGLLHLSNGCTEPPENPDAAAFLPGGQRLLGAAEIAAYRQGQLVQVETSDLDEDEAALWWHRAFVPFTEHTSPMCLLIDQRSGPHHGAVRNWMDETGPSKPRWPSLNGFLAAVADALEGGPAVRGKLPYAEGEGVLAWRPVQ
ncbi:SMI1/KNR4 family protein [Streptomyces sp. ODS28]|uniref:SMI1/KNR4 family protein n=1 Tax=Streptomyces sp. ODS28 TaxID=3136688 RepID=UPI0031F14FF0